MVTCISCKFGHQMALVQNLVISWRHLHSKVGHQIALLALLHLPWHYQLVLSCYPHQPESHQLSLHKVSEGLTDGHPDPKIGPWELQKNEN